ncbi:MAG TPA: formate dehydrogenase subunit gamma [Acetobacteraceae bacterium]|nr:formate dehydrogenase subunit gamma [Acetobacteraceae bacterium]
MSGQEPWTAERAARIIEDQAAKPGGLLPALHALQGMFGCVPEPAIPLLAAAFNLSRADVHGVVSFYHDFRRHPPGRHVLRLCRAEACQSMGAERVAAALQARLGVGWGATTADGAVTLEPAFCLGLCAVAPAALLDGQPFGRIDAESIAARVEARS